MDYCHTSFCHRCIDRHILNEKDMLDVLSDPHNHAEKRRQIIELLTERHRKKDEAERMGLA